jgi:hypothetical protein
MTSVGREDACANVDSVIVIDFRLVRFVTNQMTVLFTASVNLRLAPCKRVCLCTVRACTRVEMLDVVRR